MRPDTENISCRTYGNIKVQRQLIGIGFGASLPARMDSAL